jgi:aryl-alcohol dehydrogenase-like predicted oxidoreductase
MRTINFSGSDISTLGFGCTQLTTNYTEKAALRNLEVAYEEGITHFDTARVYGFGMSETILGKFIDGKRHKVTVASKIGLLPSPMPIRNLFLLNSVRAGINALPFLKKKVVQNTNGLRQELVFSPENAEKSLSTSLKSLHTDFLDFLLLHESNLATSNRQDVIGFLESKVKEGKIKTFGIASHYEKLPEDFSRIDPKYELIQYESNVLKEQLFKNTSGRLISLHSIFRHFNILKNAIQSRQEFRKFLDEAMNANMSSAQNISRYLIGYAQVINPDGICLFTSKNDKRIRENIRSWNTSFFSENQIKLATKIIQQHFENE